MPYSDTGGRQHLNTSHGADRSSRQRLNPNRQSRSGSANGARLRSVDNRRRRNSYSSLRAHNIRFGRESALRRLFGGNLQTILIIVVAIAVLVLVILGVSSCVRGCATKQDGTAAVNVADSRVAAGVSEELTQKFTGALDRNDKLSWIAANANQYSDTSLLELALDEPDSIDFVAAYPSSDKTAKPYGESVTAGSAPQLYDWDTRWGNVDYAGSALGVTGSGPTALSMMTGTGVAGVRGPARSSFPSGLTSWTRADSPLRSTSPTGLTAASSSTTERPARWFASSWATSASQTSM